MCFHRRPRLPPSGECGARSRYRVERQLIEVGMATVYLADDLKHDRKVELNHLPLFEERAS